MTAGPQTGAGITTPGRLRAQRGVAQSYPPPHKKLTVHSIAGAVQIGNETTNGMFILIPDYPDWMGIRNGSLVLLVKNKNELRLSSNSWMYARKFSTQSTERRYHCIQAERSDVGGGGRWYRRVTRHPASRVARRRTRVA